MREGRFGNSLQLWLTIFYLSTFIFEALLRYWLSLNGLSPLLYIRDVLLVVILIKFTVESLLLARIFEIVTIFGVIFFYMIIGWICTANILQVLFGVKMLLPFFLGIASSKNFYSNLKKIRYLFLFFFILSCCGVIINIFVQYPWSGLSYAIGDTQIEGVKQWSAFGIDRLAGFSRVSYEAATDISLLYICILVSFKSRVFHIALLPLAAVAITFTTTKGATLAFTLVVFTYLLFLFDFEQRLVSKSVNFLPLFLSIVCVGLPVISFIIVEYIDIRDPTLGFLFSSFQDRQENGWPQAMKLISDKGSFILGRGIGGMGTAQQYFEKEEYNPGDSMSLYLYCIFGIPSIMFFLFVSYKSFFLKIWKYTDLFTLLTVVFILSYGFTTAILESAFAAVFCGLAFRHLYDLSKEVKSRAKANLKAD